MTRIELDAVVERKDPKLPRFLVVPAALLAEHGIHERTAISGTFGGVRFDRRNMHPWGDGERFFVNLPEPLCRKAGVDVGDTVTLVFEPA